jgi:hypothetical protein
MRNAEYIAVLAEVVEAFHAAMADRRLPDLTPEQMAWWFRTITASDVRTVTNANAVPHLEVVWRRAA